MKNRPLVFFGTEDFSLHALRALHQAGFSVAGVITKPDTKKGRGHKLTPPAVKVYAAEQGIPVWQPTKLDELTPVIKELDTPAGVLVSYGKIIPKHFLELFTPGIINVHPSLLPRYRGPSPIESAILNQDQETGVSIMRLDAKMDAGPVYAQISHALTGTETQQELYQKLGELGAAELIKVLPDILSGTLQPIEQDESKATYCGLLRKDQAFFDPQTLTAAELEARIRAYQHFPKTKYTLEGRTVTLLSGHVSTVPSDGINIMCSDNQYVVVDRLLAPSGRQMSAKDYRNGYAAG